MQKLVEKEMQGVLEFVDLAQNKHQARIKLNTLLSDFNLSHL